MLVGENRGGEAKILKRVLAFVYNNSDVLQGAFRSEVGMEFDRIR